ncbi:MAG TPA: capsule assembly Wzi family protein [Candidatus Eisenbacteria bacterium]|nr:capsule assembly Wzi family protein [Candidatus Eisenbacteria bacterium]
MLRALAFAAVVLAAAPIVPTSAPALPIEYLPVRHAAYDEIETLAGQGLLDSLNIYTRPLARVDVAAALLRARRRDAAIAENLHYQRLERELARELTDLGAPPERPESRLLLDTGPGEQRARVSLATHLRGDYDPDREGAEFRLRDESSVTARGSFQLSRTFAAYEELGVTRIRSQREFIDAIALHSDLEMAVMRAEITARTGPIAMAAGYDQFRWGPGRRGTLLFSDAAGPLTFFQYGGSFGGRVTATAFSGVLSKADGRYFAAHRVEALVTPRLTIGLAEAVRYNGEGIDLLYGIGLLPYTIVERIHVRDASTDSVRAMERSNVMASLDAVARVSPALSLYGELLIDDLATENEEMPDRLAYQLGLRSDRPFGTHTAHVQAEYTRVRRFTYATYYGENFIHRDRPLGFTLGPDVETVWMEVGFDLSRDWQARWSGEFTNQGEGYLGESWTPDMGPVSNAGLYGVVQERREFWGDLRWMPRDQFDVSAGLGYRRVANVNHEEGATRTGWLARMALEARY